MENRQGGLRTARLRFPPIPFTAISININCGKRRPSRPRPKGDGFRSPRNRQNRSLPHNRPFAIPPKKQSPPQREFRFGNGRDGLFRSINRGKRSRGSPPVWIYPSKRLLLVAISRLYLRWKRKSNRLYSSSIWVWVFPKRNSRPFWLYEIGNHSFPPASRKINFYISAQKIGANEYNRHVRQPFFAFSTKVFAKISFSHVINRVQPS